MQSIFSSSLPNYIQSGGLRPPPPPPPSENRGKTVYSEASRTNEAVSWQLSFQRREEAYRRVAENAFEMSIGLEQVCEAFKECGDRNIHLRGLLRRTHKGRKNTRMESLNIPEINLRGLLRRTHKALKNAQIEYFKAHSGDWNARSVDAAFERVIQVVTQLQTQLEEVSSQNLAAIEGTILFFEAVSTIFDTKSDLSSFQLLNLPSTSLSAQARGKAYKQVADDASEILSQVDLVCWKGKECVNRIIDLPSYASLDTGLAACEKLKSVLDHIIEALNQPSIVDKDFVEVIQIITQIRTSLEEVERGINAQYTAYKKDFIIPKEPLKAARKGIERIQETTPVIKAIIPIFKNAAKEAFKDSIADFRLLSHLPPIFPCSYLVTTQRRGNAYKRVAVTARDMSVQLARVCKMAEACLERDIEEPHYCTYKSKFITACAIHGDLWYSTRTALNDAQVEYLKIHPEAEESDPILMAFEIVTLAVTKTLSCDLKMSIASQEHSYPEDFRKRYLDIARAEIATMRAAISTLKTIIPLFTNAGSEALDGAEGDLSSFTPSNLSHVQSSHLTESAVEISDSESEEEVEVSESESEEEVEVHESEIGLEVNAPEEAEGISASEEEVSDSSSNESALLIVSSWDRIYDNCYSCKNWTNFKRIMWIFSVATLGLLPAVLWVLSNIHDFWCARNVEQLHI